MKAVTVHCSGCPEAANPGDLHVVYENENMETLVAEVFRLLEEHDLPFYSVQAHNKQCPGCHFPWEELELRLFILQH
ncbi:MAG: hypothetical protein ACOX2G_03045 [Bacillota bacterium]